MRDSHVSAVAGDVAKATENPGDTIRNSRYSKTKFQSVVTNVKYQEVIGHEVG